MPRTFVILTTQRTGSTYLVTLLDSHPEIRCYGELYLDPPASNLHYWTWIKNSRTRRLIAKYLGAYTYGAHLRYVLKMSSKKKAVGFKLMYDQADRHPGMLSVLRSGWQTIHLVRRNVVRTYLSRVLARTRKNWSSKERLAPIRVRVDLEAMKKEMDVIRGGVKRYRAALIPTLHMEVAYEDLPQATVRACILDFLGVRPDVDLKSDLVKVNREGMREIVENYEAMREFFRNSDYEEMIEE